MTNQSEDTVPPGARLDQIPTRWSLLRLAHADTVTAAGPARNALVLRYNRAIRNYVGALLRDEHDADEVAQEVVERLLRGQFASASPERGSFRRMLMVAAHNLVRSHWAKKQRRPSVPLEPEALVDSGPSLAEEALRSWRAAVLDLAWRALQDYERTHPGSVAYTLLRLREQHPDNDSEELAARLTQQTGRAFRADAMRQQLRRARMRFVELLLEEVARTLDEPTPERVEEELTEAGLMPYVQDLLPPDWRSRGELAEG
jgi:RNA polymerase sigma factor (sigma-70 family)